MMDKAKMDKEQFKKLCLSVVPAIFEIAEEAKKSCVDKGMSITIGEDGYVSFSLYDENWRFTKFSGEDAGRISYEFSEKLEVPHPEIRKLEFGHLTENVTEIAMVFADMQKEHSKLAYIESMEWKQRFVEWANEFEERWNEDDVRDYPEEIDRFAREKIMKYADTEVAE